MMLLDETRSQKSPHSKLVLRLQVAAITAILGTTAYAAKGIAQVQRDRVITIDEARSLARSVTGAEGIPLEIDELVVQELNRRVETPAKRREMREILERMKRDYLGVVEPVLARHRLPRAIRAIPIIESGYRNLPEVNPPRTGRGAGIWMFIPQTARRFGVRVDSEVDERMDVAKLSDAAGRYLKINALEFKDLGLSILAYNWGESALAREIERTGSRDVRELSRARDDRYYAQLVAAILIDANPKLVE